MIKKIQSHELRVGMYVHALSHHWTAHPFIRNRFRVTSSEQIQKIIEAGIIELEINTVKGLAATEKVASEAIIAASPQTGKAVANIAALVPAGVVSFAEEIVRARLLKDQALHLVRDLMQDARLGKIIELERAEPIVQEIVASVTRNPSALLALLHIKNKDDYTFLHSVSVCALLAAFCRSIGLQPEVTYQAALGGLVHDLGKSKVPDAILNKPGRLTEAEFDIIKQHPEDGHAILSAIAGIGPIPLDITLRHHERLDGSGYPGKLSGDTISELAQMAAIVDVYDAITAERCYHNAMSPPSALGKLHEWGEIQYDSQLVQAFIRCLGIYPSGSMVLLQSGRLGVVTQQHEENLLEPSVNVFFSTRSNTYIAPHTVNLLKSSGKAGSDKILRAETPAKWRIDPLRFLEIVET
jgi:HD-GYP domain-containing protein (c-di-GMP phosphodiesterase class II)